MRHRTRLVLYIAFVIALAALSVAQSVGVASAPPAKSPISAGDREKVLTLIQKLQQNPFYEGADDDRRWVAMWVSQQADSGMRPCGEPLSPLMNSDYKYARIIFYQGTFGAVQALLQNFDRVPTPLEATTAMVNSALGAYEVILKTDKDAHTNVMDDLLAKEQDGSLAAYVAEETDACESTMKKGNIVPAPTIDPETGTWGSNRVDAMSNAFQNIKPEELPTLKKKAEAGDPHSELLLGGAYLSGIDAPPDEVVLAPNAALAIRWIRRAAEDGSPEAQAVLGSMSEKLGDSSEALRWYRKAGEQSEPDALYRLGQIYDAGIGIEPDKAQALTWYGRAAQSGKAEAAFRLAQMLDAGEGGPKDSRKATEFYLMSSMHGYSAAQVILAQRYRDGIGTPPDIAQAERWYRSAAEQGDVEAQYQVGKILADPKGQFVDLRSAYEWLKLSEIGGNSSATDLLAQVTPKLALDQIEKAEKTISTWLDKHPGYGHDQGSSQAPK